MQGPQRAPKGCKLHVLSCRLLCDLHCRRLQVDMPLPGSPSFTPPGTGKFGKLSDQV